MSYVLMNVYIIYYVLLLNVIDSFSSVTNPGVGDAGFECKCICLDTVGELVFPASVHRGVFVRPPAGAQEGEDASVELSLLLEPRWQDSHPHPGPGPDRTGRSRLDPV